ncbi:MAG TPA: hypothetical protein DEO40_03130 [Treponema sp.]|jgi:hypothetical protein|nr:hypothetical protein [Treponema sp.]
MKKHIALVAMLCMTLGAFAGAREIFTNYCDYVDEGDVIVNVGPGLNEHLGRLGYGNLSFWIPPVEASVEFTVKLGQLPFGFGGVMGYYGYAWNDGSLHSYHTVYTAPFVNYHINVPVPNLDIYAGLSAGISMGFGNSYFGVAPYIAPHIGATWYFTKGIGINLESGWPMFLRVAVSIKF